MAPKPFPYPIGVGVDICHIPRLYATLDHPSEYVTRWARKIFTRQEWPCLLKRCSQASGRQNLQSSLWIPGFRPATAPETKEYPALLRDQASQDPSQTEDAHHKAIPQDQSDARRTMMEPDSVFDVHSGTTDPPLPLSVPPQALRLLAQHLAGRFVLWDLPTSCYNELTSKVGC